MKNITILILLAFMAVFPLCRLSATDAQGDKTGYSENKLMDDARITAAVKSKLAGDNLVAHRNIVVESTNGMVVLKGTVADQAEHDRAVELTKTVDGVMSVESHLQIQAQQPSNQSSGPIDDAKDAAKDVAKDAKEAAKKVGDAVEDGADALSAKAIDAKITTEIKLKFAEDDLVKSSDISVDTTGRRVTLTGTVSSKAQKNRAIQIAHSVKDVQKVDSHLTIKASHS